MWTLKAVMHHRCVCRITCWISSPCASLPSSYAGCGIWLIRLCFLGSCQSCELCAYHWLESPERPAGCLGFLGMAAFLFALHIFGARSTLFRWTPTGHAFLWCRWRRGQPRAFLNVILHLLARGGDGTKAGSTCKIRIVMHADNMVKVGWIVLDGVRAEWTIRHAWPMPVLGFSRQANRDTNKCASHMQFLQQTQRSNSSTLEDHNDIWLSLCAGK